MEIEASDDDGHPWPVDMERRRKAALREFHRNNPDYKQGLTGHFAKRQPQEINRQQSGDRKRGGLPSTTVSASVIERRSTRPERSRDNKSNRPFNRWNLETTLELLESLKAYVRANKLRGVGRNLARWRVVVANLTNPSGLELSHLARGSMSKLTEIRRPQKRGRLELEVQQSLFDYEKICESNGALRSKYTSSRPNLY